MPHTATFRQTLVHPLPVKSGASAVALPGSRPAVAPGAARGRRAGRYGTGLSTVSQ